MTADPVLVDDELDPQVAWDASTSTFRAQAGTP